MYHVASRSDAPRSDWSYGGKVAVPPDAPWLMKRAPTGFNLSEWHKATWLTDGACCTADNPMCTPRVIRYQGLTFSNKYAENTGSSGPALPSWFNLPSGEHYLRAIARSPTNAWEIKRKIEIDAFKIAVHAMWFIQKHVPRGSGNGFCNSSFPHGLNARAPWAGDVGAAPYTLAARLQPARVRSFVLLYTTRTNYTICGVLKLEVLWFATQAC